MSKCWFCGEEEGNMYFSVEFDTYFHMSCLLKAGNTHPEAKFMFKEYGISDSRVVLVALHTEEEEKYVMLKNQQGIEWFLMDSGMDNVIYEVDYKVSFPVRYKHKKGKDYFATEGGIQIGKEKLQLYIDGNMEKVFLRPYEMFHGYDDDNVKRFVKIL